LQQCGDDDDDLYVQDPVEFQVELQVTNSIFCTTSALSMEYLVSSLGSSLLTVFHQIGPTQPTLILLVAM